ncbi:MAG: hypothetical protein Q8K32_00925 [Archangium sp.]|nr:hypothetical protein [Archangium sp.]
MVFTSCVDASHQLDGSSGVVEVIETAPPVDLTPEPVIAPLPLALLAPELIYLEPIALPARHVVIATTSPAQSRKLGAVQSVEIEVEVEGGAYGAREISAVFVSPQGLVWERQATLIDARRGEKQVAHFSLPVASTFIEDQQLSGTWQITTLDDGAELASATFALEE